MIRYLEFDKRQGDQLYRESWCVALADQFLFPLSHAIVSLDTERQGLHRHAQSQKICLHRAHYKHYIQPELYRARGKKGHTANVIVVEWVHACSNAIAW